MKSIPIPGKTDWNAFENNINWKHKNRLKQSYEIGNKNVDCKHSKLIGDKTLHWKLFF